MLCCGFFNGLDFLGWLEFLGLFVLLEEGGFNPSLLTFGIQKSSLGLFLMLKPYYFRAPQQAFSLVSLCAIQAQYPRLQKLFCKYWC